MIGPERVLPFLGAFNDAADYVQSLEQFVTSSQILQTLCGGIHILDIFTRTPDLYQTILPLDWRQWFEKHDVQDLLELLLRENLATPCSSNSVPSNLRSDLAPPPQSLVQFILDVRRHCLDTEFRPSSIPLAIGAHARPKKKHERYTPSQHAMTAGMNPKKVHEVSNFAHFVAELCNKVKEHDEANAPHSEQNHCGISHIVDFGSGQNYLGRVLAREPYGMDVIAIESRAHVVEGAKKMDTRVNLVKKELIMRNKKEFKQMGGWKRIGKPDECNNNLQTPQVGSGQIYSQLAKIDKTPRISPQVNQCKPMQCDVALNDAESSIEPVGSVQYIQHRIMNGDIASAMQQVSPLRPHSLMVVSLHSCGNLVHHGLRTVELNPSVRVVAMVGCCYNLMTERLGPPSYKIPELRANVTRLIETSSQRDPHGFPMSERFARHVHKLIQPNNYGSNRGSTSSLGLSHEDTETGIRMNITARMMAVQAPRNWTESTSKTFFTRHFYRAVLQRIFMDRGIVDPPESGQNTNYRGNAAGSDSASIMGTAPVVIGGLSKACYESFVAYVRGAVAKLVRITTSPLTAKIREPKAGPAMTEDERDQTRGNPQGLGVLVQERIGSMSDHEIQEYEDRFIANRKDLSITWSLMAFSAQIMEALIVVDRWLWLNEQESVEEAWVQTVFEYEKSPRNMVVVGIRKHGTKLK